MPAHDPTTRTHHALITLGLVALGTAAAWAALFAWDNQVVVRDGDESGPYETWQGVALVVVLAALVVVATWLGQGPVGTSLVLAATLAVCFATSFTVLAPPTPDASLWPIGVALIFCGAFLATLLLAGPLSAGLGRSGGRR